MLISLKIRHVLDPDARPQTEGRSVHTRRSFFRCVRKIAKSDYEIRHVRPSYLHPSVRMDRFS